MSPSCAHEGDEEAESKTKRCALTSVLRACHFLLNAQGRNTFQFILAGGRSISFALGLLPFDGIKWYLTLTPAGYQRKGTPLMYYNLPCSKNFGTCLNTSNVGQPGLWVIRK